MFGISFAAPLVLLGLLSLPAIWWLLRLTPPRPKEEIFPPTRILQQVLKPDETPASSPWWLTLLRLLLAAILIFAVANPLMNQEKGELAGEGPILMIVDNSWSTAAGWNTRRNSILSVLQDAEIGNRPVALILTADPTPSELVTIRAEQAATIISAAQPRPIKNNLEPLTTLIKQFPAEFFGSVIWFSSGIADPDNSEFQSIISQHAVGQKIVYMPSLAETVVLTGSDNQPDAMVVDIQRVVSGSSSSGQVTAFDQQGRSIGTSPFTFANTDKTSQAKFVIPVELRNEIASVSIDQSESAAAVQLLDEGSRRKRVGLISGTNADLSQPLLSPLYYISRALAPFSEVREAEVASVMQAVPKLISEQVTTMVLADIGNIPDEARQTLQAWVERGGMLIRFAGPKLAGAQDDSLVPVTLRRGGRSLGGTLTWGTPQPLTAFETNSPFNGIPVPPDVTVTRQVLAEPSIDLADKTWASLADGTPLVTASEMGKGWIVLFHVTADASWSNLPLSGAFVDMLRKIVSVEQRGLVTSSEATNASANDAKVLPPLRILDASGRFTSAGNDVQPLKITAQEPPKVSIINPPGLYGSNESFVSLNLFSGPADLKSLDVSGLGPGVSLTRYVFEKPISFKPYLFAAAFILLALDCIAVLWMAGAFSFKRRTLAASSIYLLVSCVTLGFSASEPFAQDQKPDINFENALKTRLAYVRTGVSNLDAVSRKGLIGLTQFIASRTALEPGDPVGVDIASDPLEFYPLLYWPVSGDTPTPNNEAMARIDAFMKNGGTVLFDTRDQLSGGFGGSTASAATQRLRQILSSLDISPLEPVPANHVLTRAFYLLDIFPGRYLQGRLWVEASSRSADEDNRPARIGDGVSSIMITSNDLAGAWAVEANGAPSLPTVPPNPTQRIYAYRTGVNIVMYTLTGNYKSDQVHIPALLERLGQ